MIFRSFATAFICFLAVPAVAALHSVSIQGFAFSPSSIDIELGDTVEWTNLDSFRHTVTEDNGLFDSGSMLQNDTFSFTFDDAGAFGYFCGFHPSMTGTVNVDGGACDLTVDLSGAPRSVARGGTLSFTAAASNPCPDTMTFNEAIMSITGPASLNQTLYDGPNVPVPSGNSRNAPISLGVPGIAPLGLYTVTVTIYRGAGEEVASSSFNVSVTD